MDPAWYEPPQDATKVVKSTVESAAG
jgi:hypothetical protein